MNPKLKEDRASQRTGRSQKRRFLAPHFEIISTSHFVWGDCKLFGLYCSSMKFALRPKFMLSVGFAFAISFMQIRPSFAASQIACQNLFYEPSPATKMALLNKYLKESNGTSNHSTVTWVDHTDQKVVFSKPKDALWLSRHIALEESLTAEGDLRLPMFLFGAKLAMQFGFGIYEFENNLLEVTIPDADLIAARVAKINASLKMQGREPIRYLPVRTGYITAEEGIDLALVSGTDFLMQFPYADLDRVIVTHEAAFHLGAMMLPTKILRRARSITEETINFANLLKAEEGAFGKNTAAFIHQLLLERSFELDAGLASSVTTPAHARRDNGMKSYSETFNSMTERSWKYMSRSMEYLNRPQLQPFEAVLTRLQLMTGVNLSELIHGDNSGFTATQIPSQKIGDKIRLSKQEVSVLLKVVKTFYRQPRPIFESNSPRSLAEYYIQGLDQRISEISASLDENIP